MDFRIVAVRGGRLFGPRELSCCDSQVINRDTVHVAIGTAPGTRTGCQAPLKREFLKKSHTLHSFCSSASSFGARLSRMITTTRAT